MTTTGDPGPAPSRADLLEQCREDIVEAGAAFLAELHNVDFHYYSDGYDLDEGLPVDDVAELVLHLTEQVTATAGKAAADVRAASARRDWLLAGAPLRCGLCGGDIDSTYEDWRVCGGLAEHEDCHHDDDPDPADRDREDRGREDRGRRWTLAEDEHQAYLEERTRTGPRPGDRVRLTYGDGSGSEGTWTVIDDGQPAVRRDDGTLHRHVTGQVRREVVELGEDLT